MLERRRYDKTDFVRAVQVSCEGRNAAHLMDGRAVKDIRFHGKQER
jgi:hypothetical protein